MLASTQGFSSPYAATFQCSEGRMSLCWALGIDKEPWKLERCLENKTAKFLIWGYKTLEDISQKALNGMLLV